MTETTATCSYQLRSRKRKLPVEEAPIFNNTISDLPDEVLLEVFKYLNAKELQCNVRPVCRRFLHLSETPKLRKRIVVTGNNTPTNILLKWINWAPELKYFKITKRRDTNEILTALSKKCRDLEEIEIFNCWGFSGEKLISAKKLCKLVTKCRHLERCCLRNVKIHPLNFCRLLENSPNVSTKFFFEGPMAARQYKSFQLGARRNNHRVKFCLSYEKLHKRH